MQEESLNELQYQVYDEGGSFPQTEHDEYLDEYISQHHFDELNNPQ